MSFVQVTHANDFEQTKVRLPKAKASLTESEVEDDAVLKTKNTLIQIAVSYHQMMSYLFCRKLQNFIPKLTFSGASEVNFEAHVQVNLNAENQAKSG